VQCSWQAYKSVTDPTSPTKILGRQQLTELSATGLQDLPAYVEMKVSTASGLTANWMFEVGWTNGPETMDEAQQDGTLAGGGGPGGPGGGPGNGRFGGGPGGPGGPGNARGQFNANLRVGPGGATIIGKDGRATTVPQLGPKPGGRGG
jgi:hypothetical protein